MLTYSKIMLVVSLLLLPRLARAEIHFVASKENQKVISAIPKSLLSSSDQSITVIESVSTRQWLVLTKHLQKRPEWSFAWEGVFVPDENTIYFQKRATNKPLLLHEVAHCIWSYHLTEEEKERYNTAWVFDCATGQLPSAYSQTSPSEGFAECFRIYLGAKEKNDGALSSRQKDFFSSLL